MTSHISSVMGFLTTSLHKNCQNDVKLLETWWFWPILGKVERAELTCDVIKKSCSTFLIKFWLPENSDFSKPPKIMPWIFKLYNQWDISKETLTLFLLWWCPSGQTNKIRCQLILTNDFHSKWLIIVMIKMRLKTEVVINPMLNGFK